MMADYFLLFYLKFLLFFNIFIHAEIYQAEVENNVPISVKESGVVIMNKDIFGLRFYILLENTAVEPLDLIITSKCCQKITKEEQDCESMKLIGGNMGSLYPQQSRNLTLVYANLFPHNREGSCDVEITNMLNVTIPFNTMLVIGEKVHVPRLLEQYYDLEDTAECQGLDEDPLNACNPYDCNIRYDGTRSHFNIITRRCEKIPKCSDNPATKELGVYDVNSGKCRTIKSSYSHEELEQLFKEDKASVHALQYKHQYPNNIICENGEVDLLNGCLCREGFTSAKFDPKSFNPDIHIYIMCSVWMGDMKAEEAKYITFKSISHQIPNLIYYSLGVLILAAFCFCIWYFKKDIYRRLKLPNAERHEESELTPLTEHDSNQDSLNLVEESEL